MSSIPSLFGPEMPVELKQMFLYHLPLSQQCQARRVCKEWSNLLTAEVIWKPVFRELNPFLDSQTYQNTDVTQITILADLQANQKKVDLIVSLIESDSQLHSIIGSSCVSLENLNQMIPLERSLHVMRGLRNNCTELLLYLLAKHNHDFTNYIQIARQRYGEPLWGMRKLQNFCLSEFYQKDQCLPLVQELLKAPPGPFNAGKTLLVAHPLAHTRLAIKAFQNICAPIVRSHYDLSEFFEANLPYKESRSKPISGAEFARRVLIPYMNTYYPDITEDDWIQCGLRVCC